MKKESITDTVVKNTAYNLAATILNRIGTLVFTIVIARILLPEAFGLYNLTISIALILLTVGEFGINSSLITYISNNLAKNNPRKAAAYLYYLRKLKFLLISSSSVLLIGLSYPIANFVFHKPQIFLPLLISSFYLFVIGLESFYSALLFAVTKIFP